MHLDTELATLTTLLDLDEFEVVESAWDRRGKLRRFTLVPKMSVGVCPHCLRLSERQHACHDRVIADLPMGGQRVELIVQLFQFECDSCNKFFTPRYAALVEGTYATERLLEKLADLAKHGDIANAARFFGIPEKTVEGWYYRYVERKLKDPSPHLQPVKSLGIDELSLKKDSVNSFAC